MQIRWSAAILATLVIAACSGDPETSNATGTPNCPECTSGADGGDAGSDGSCTPTGPGAYVNGPSFDAPAPATVDPVVHPISKNRLSARFDHDTVPSGSAGDWSISSTDDPAFSSPKSPSGIFVRSRAAALTTDTWPYKSVPEYEAILELGSPLKPGATYTLSSNGKSWSFAFAPDKQWSPAIKINQIGYLQGAPGRHAYVGYWLGSLAPMNLGQDELAFHVVDAGSGATVLSGQLAMRADANASEDANGTNYSKATVYDADLTPLDRAGHYYVVWDGVGRSPTFALDASVYDLPFITVFRALFHQRCGTELSPALTKWSHKACHMNATTLTTADYQVVGEDAFTALPAAATGQTVDVHGGYHDAGDYDKNYSHLIVVDDLVDLYEIAPTRYARDDFAIPESGNKIPDILDEATWALSYWAKLQVAEGGVPGCVGTTHYPAIDQAPDTDDTPWYACAPDPLATYWFAGAAAKLSRAMRAFDAVRADGWLTKAKAAWTWAEQNRRDYEKHTLDAYAAAELFKTTGDGAFEAAFVKYSPFSGNDIALPDGDDGSIVPALYAYVTANGAAAERKTAVLSALTARAQSWVSWGKKTGYRFVKHPYAPIGYGSYTTPREAGFLFRMHAITHDPQLLEWGTYTCDLSLGANAAGLSWTSGLGQFAIQRPFHTPSLADAIDQVVPGLTVYGPSYNLSTGGSQAPVIGAYQPNASTWPSAELYADVSYSPILNEFTVHDSIAPTAFAFGYLATLNNPCK